MDWIGGGALLLRSRWALLQVKERCSRPGERRARKGGALRPAAGTSGSPSMLCRPSFLGVFSQQAMFYTTPSPVSIISFSYITCRMNY